MARILVVEDEAGIAVPLEDDLRAEGYEVTVVADGNAAIAQAPAKPFDLVLLDVMLPGRDGFDVCRELRRAGRDMPIIMLTAKALEAEKVLGLELGADDYVTKPYSPMELRARIRAALRRQGGEEPEIYCFGELELDFTRCELRRAGRVIELTPLELKLLGTFVHKRGRVLSRRQLLDEVWGQSAYVTDRSVDNQIANLRKKIEVDAAEPHYLISVRGMGYRFDG